MNKLLIALCLTASFGVSAWDELPANLDMNFTVSSSTDEMNGVTHWHAESDATKPPVMNFPYDGTVSRIYLTCSTKTKKLYSYFWFSSTPNISHDKTESGYSVSSSRIKFDDKLDSITLNQVWGESFMGAKYHKFLIDNLKGTKEVKLELDWHGSGSVVFSYKTNKAEIAIAEISNKCGIK